MITVAVRGLAKPADYLPGLPNFTFQTRQVAAGSVGVRSATINA